VTCFHVHLIAKPCWMKFIHIELHGRIEGLSYIGLVRGNIIDWYDIWKIILCSVGAKIQNAL
jgi:hypothetical protein